MKAKFFLPLLALLATVVACTGTPDQTGGEGEIIDGKINLIIDHQFIRANGEEAVNFTVLVQDASGMFQNVTSDAQIYAEGNSTPLAEPKFTSESSGEWTFYALYGLEVSNEVNVKAVAGIADIPADPAPESTDFHHRIMLLQHTGTACPNCPGMMTILKNLAEDTAYADRYNHVASHSYSYDPSYPDAAHSADADELSRHLAVMFYPWLTYNLTEVTDYELSDIKARIDQLQKATADVGISLSASEADGAVYANVAIKAAKSGKYRMAVWLLEDGIFAKQAGKVASWQETHNNALRAMVGETKTERIYGKSIGTIEAGKTYENLVAINELDAEWVVSACEVMVLITAEDANGNYDVVNTAVCKVGESYAYEYNK